MKAQFLLGKPNIKISQHFNQRLKNRLSIKKEKHRHKFIKNIADSAISIYNIPQEGEYDNFYSYMYNKMRSIQRKNLYTFLVLFKQWFVVTSVDGVLITIFEVEDQYKDIYSFIKKSIDDQENKECG